MSQLRHALKQDFERFVREEKLAPELRRIESPSELSMPSSDESSKVAQAESASGLKQRIKNIPVIGKLVFMLLGMLKAQQTREDVFSLAKKIAKVEHELFTTLKQTLTAFKQLSLEFKYFARYAKQQKQQTDTAVHQIHQRLNILSTRVDHASQTSATLLPFDYEYSLLCASPRPESSHFQLYTSWIQQAIAKTSSSLVLDLGSGLGEFVRFAQQQHWQVTGVERNPKCIEYAREQAMGDFVEDDVVHFLRSQNAQTWSAITALQLAPHLTEADALDLFGLALAALKHGGVLVVDSFSQTAWQTKISSKQLSHMLTWLGFSQVNILNTSLGDVVVGVK